MLGTVDILEGGVEKPPIGARFYNSVDLPDHFNPTGDQLAPAIIDENTVLYPMLYI